MELSDLPTGWKQNTAVTKPDKTGKGACNAGLVLGNSAGASSAVEFDQGNNEQVTENAYTFSGGAQAQTVFEKLRAATGCSSFDAGGHHITVSPVNLGALGGDRSFSIQETVPSKDIQVIADVAVVQIGAAIIELSHIDIITIDSDLTHTLVAKAVSRAQG